MNKNRRPGNDDISPDDIYPDDIIDPDDLIDPDDGDWPDPDDIDEFKRNIRRIRRYIKRNHVTPRTYIKRKNRLIRDLRKSIDAVDLLILSKAYLKGATYSSFVRSHRTLRRSVLKALLSNMDVDAQIIILQDLLRELCGDTEPQERYIT